MDTKSIEVGSNVNQHIDDPYRGGDAVVSAFFVAVACALLYFAIAYFAAKA